MSNITLNSSNILQLGKDTVWNNVTITPNGYFIAIKDTTTKDAAIELDKLKSLTIIIALNVDKDILVKLKTITFSFDITSTADDADIGKATFFKYTDLPKNIYWKAISASDKNNKVVNDGFINVKLKQIGD